VTLTKSDGVFHPRRPKGSDHQILFRLQKVDETVGTGDPPQCALSGQIRILYAPQQVPFDRVDQDSVAETQLRPRLIVLLLIMQGDIFIIPKVVNHMDSQWAEIAEELAASDIETANPVEFGPARRLVCCAIRFGSGWTGGPNQIRGGRIGSSIVLAVGRHAAHPRGLETFPWCSLN
jgi:hypothetical protein